MRFFTFGIILNSWQNVTKHRTATNYACLMRFYVTKMAKGE